MTTLVLLSDLAFESNEKLDQRIRSSLTVRRSMRAKMVVGL
ncbi:hypothetical protein MHB43_08430 [Paenibacillus sp. FSL H8-0317]